MDAGSTDAGAGSKTTEASPNGDGSPMSICIDDAAAAETSGDDGASKIQSHGGGCPTGAAASATPAARGDSKASSSSKTASAAQISKGRGKGKGNHPMNAGIMKLQATRMKLKQEQNKLAKEIKLEGKKRSRTLRNARRLTDEELVQVVVARGCSQLVQPLLDKTAAEQLSLVID